MDIFEFVGVLKELYPRPPEHDPMEECRRIKKEVAREYWSLPPEERENYFNEPDDDLDGPGLDIENLTREELIKILKEEDRMEEAKKREAYEYRQNAAPELAVAEPPPAYGGAGATKR